MFEGLVRQLLLGYLGRYIKDFQKEQLKITLWNEKVYLEDVELILEAFDYLQLPVALKRGHVGRLSIRIPWKKLGWDPIIIELEDVFFFAGPRDDHEWSADAVERRELAAKKAKLAAAELAKLSRRVCDNQAGQSLISHVTGRILDSIQISMRNVHVSYSEMQSQSMLFGVKFSRLEITKQSPAGPLNLKARGGQVNKIVEIHDVGIHCSHLEGSLGFMGANDAGENELWQSAVNDVKYDYIVKPFDLSLQVTKSGKLEVDAPQYSITAELLNLVMTINPTQLEHILKFSDYICTCQLREKYGRYRPWDFPLSKKFKGWQKIWWQYAKDSVLSDVRKRLKKTSWRYLGQRLDHRRKYVNLYKDKLNFLQREQPIDQEKLFELEQMEKDFDIDDILWFRSIAERELEDSLCLVSYEAKEGCTSTEKLPNDEAATGRARGWLNWLSRGVLGAGGTDDSSQFSGVVSDEVLKDICEATKFQPMPSVNIASDGLTFLFAVNFHITKMSLLLKSVNLAQDIAELSCSAIDLEFNVREESTGIIAKVGSADVSNPLKQMAILQLKQVNPEENVLSSENPSASIKVDITTKNQMEQLMFRVTIQLVVIDSDLESLSHLMEFYNILDSHMSMKERVLLSLDGIRDVRCRLQSKAECVLSGRQRVSWDVTFVKVAICLPWENEKFGACSMIVDFNGLQISSKSNIPLFAFKGKDWNCLALEDCNDILHTLDLNNMYDYYEVSMDETQVSLIMPHLPQGLSVVDKFSACVSIAHCIIPDELILKQLEVFGSAGVIGNPMGFARRVGLGVKDFLSVPAKGILQSPSGLISGMAHGTSSLLNNTLYAISDTATQFSKAAHKGILAFTFDNQEPLKTEQRIFPSSHSKGVINELFEGLTGLLQSPIRGAEKHGLPGVLSGFAFGVTGLVAKPAASVLEATGRTAQSIRNRSRLHRTGLHHLRVRLPRSLSTEIPLRPYSWEEAIGTTVLLEVEDSKFKDEVLVMCKSLQIAGRFVVLTENLILVIECSSLVDLGKSQFQGIVGEPEWKLIVEIALESVIHADVDEEVVHIVGSSSNTPIGPNHNRHGSTEGRLKKLNKPPTPLPLFQTNFELASNEEAEFFLRVLLSTIEQGREQGWGNVYLLHQSNLRK